MSIIDQMVGPHGWPPQWIVEGLPKPGESRVVFPHDSTVRSDMLDRGVRALIATEGQGAERVVLAVYAAMLSATAP